MNESKDFPHLFSPLVAGRLRLRNRLVMTAHGTQMVENGCVSRRQIDYLAARAKGGVGLIVTEAMSVHPTSGQLYDSVHLWSQRTKPSLARLADAVHAHDAPLLCQLNHAGRKQNSVYNPRDVSWSSSPIEHPGRREVPHGMSVAEIQEIVHAYSDAAALVAEAGCDGVELHMANGYLMEQFISPLVNKRDDRYGGSLEKRIRFPREVVRAVRQRIPNHVVGVKLAAEPVGNGLLTWEDIQEIARCFEQDDIDYLHANTGGHSGPLTTIPPMGTPAAAFVHLAANVKRAVKVPVVASHRITTPEQAEDVLASGQADLVGVARALIADPEWPAKAQSGTAQDIRPCVGAMECHRHIWEGAPVGCSVNASAGREREYRIAQARHRKTVAVVGGGPAGLEAARVLAMRGHLVHLFEQAPSVGGKLLYASSIPGREEFLHIVQWLEQQAVKAGAYVHRRTEFSLSTVEHTVFDAVVLAVGARYKPPSTVFSSAVPHYNLEAAVSLTDNLHGQAALVIDREYLGKGLMLAYKLATLGAEVTLLSEGQPIAPDADTVTRALYQQKVAEHGVRSLSYGKVLRLEGQQAVLWQEGGEVHLPRVDMIAVVEKPVADTTLATQIADRHPELPCHVIGDCHAPRRTIHAINDAHRVALGV